MNSYLLPTYEFGPLVFARIAKLVPESHWDERLSPERFTLREAIAHMADWEPIFRARIQQVKDNPGSTVEVYDEGEMAVQNKYGKSDMFEMLKKLIDERKATAKLVNQLSKEDLAKTCIHPERGQILLEDMVSMIQSHDLYHLEHASEYLIWAHPEATQELTISSHGDY